MFQLYLRRNKHFIPIKIACTNLPRVYRSNAINGHIPEVDRRRQKPVSTTFVPFCSDQTNYASTQTDHFQGTSHHSKECVKDVTHQYNRAEIGERVLQGEHLLQYQYVPLKKMFVMLSPLWRASTSS